MKHYIVYQITNLTNQMIYIGQHQTNNPNDSYMGSGILIQKAIQKYGKSNFKKDILFDFSTFNEMNAKEAELVTEEFVQRDDTYNLMPGGDFDKGYAMRGRKVINNGIQQKLIAIYDIPKYIANGWELGLLESTKEKLRIKGWKWIRNSKLNEQHLVLESDLQKYLAKEIALVIDFTSNSEINICCASFTASLYITIFSFFFKMLANSN